MSVKVYQSTDADAPVLTGQAGTLITLLDAVLVNGYGPRTISSITRTGDVATATTTTVHGLPIGGAVPIKLLIAGADQAAYNGEKVVTPLTTTTFSFAVLGSPATPATGSITCKRASLGWSKAYSGTSKAAYRMPAGSTQHYLQVQDDNTSTSQRSANVRGWETMSDVDNGTGPFPTVAQQAGKGQWVYKSGTQNATARRWKVIGDGKLFYLMTYPYDTATTVSSIYLFGEFISFRSADAFHTVIFAGDAEQTGTSGNVGIPLATYAFSSLATARSATQGHYVARSYPQIGSAVLVGKLGDAVASSIGQQGMSYPNSVDNGYHLGVIKVTDAGFERGIWPGILQPLHSTVLEDGDVVSDIAGLPDRKVMIFVLTTAGSSSARVAFDFVGPWR